VAKEPERRLSKGDLDVVDGVQYVLKRWRINVTAADELDSQPAYKRLL